MSAKENKLRLNTLLSLFGVMVVFVLHSQAYEPYASLKSKLHHVGVDDKNINTIVDILELRRANRESIRSFHVSFTKMRFASPLQLSKWSDKYYRGIVPPEALPNPEISKFIVKKTERSQYGLLYHPYRVQRFMSVDNDIEPNDEKNTLYAPISIRKEYVKEGSLIVSVEDRKSLSADAPLSIDRIEGVISDSGEHEWLASSIDFSPQSYEIHSFEQKMDDIAEATATLKDMYRSTENGDDIVALVLEYPHKEFHIAKYSINKNGLLVMQEIIIPFSDNEGLHERKIQLSNLSFYQVDNNGFSIYVPSHYERNDYIDDEFREKLIFNLDESLSTVNPEIPDEEFAVIIPEGKDVNFWNHRSKNSLTQPDLYRRYTDLPASIKPLVKHEKAELISTNRYFSDEDKNQVRGIIGQIDNPHMNGSQHLVGYNPSSNHSTPTIYYDYGDGWSLNFHILMLGIFLLLCGLILRTYRRERFSRPK